MVIRFEASTPRGALSIQGYSTSGFRAAGHVFDGGLVITPEQADIWPLEKLADATVEHFSLVITNEPSIEILLLGTGSVITWPTPELLGALKEQGLSVDVMDSRAAARTFNVLVAEGRRVAATLLPLSA